MDKVQAVLIDTVSIQPYIFGSNKLKENIGASFLVQNIFDSLLQKAIQAVFAVEDFDIRKWEEPEVWGKTFEQHPSFDIGYIGGGNALLLFQGEQAREKIQELIQEWTKLLLLETPGITTAIASGELELTDEHFQETKKRLFLHLDENKSRYILQTILPTHGITAQCSRTGLSIEADIQATKESRYISSMARAKILAADQANKKIHSLFKEVLAHQYGFTDQLDNLGQSKDEDSHIAIVHIDGNDMGDLFKKPKTLREIRELSIKVRKATTGSFARLLRKIIEELPSIKKEGIKTEPENGKAILPIRPIIIGGDDVTFVCDGRLGIYFAQIFLKAFTAECEQCGLNEEKPITACAGIAITKTKYPFFRGYELSEQLCSSAKNKRYEQGRKGSWLDFHIAYGGFSGKLKNIRDAHYTASQGSLLLRPYQLDSDAEDNFETLVIKTSELKYHPDRPGFQVNFPNLKIKELRNVLSQGEESAITFAKEQAARRRTLPKYEGKNYHEKLFENSKTPYFDMIELMEYYPDFVLRQKHQEVSQ